MNRNRFISICAAAVAGALLPSPRVRAGSAAQINERFQRMWSLYGQYRRGTPGMYEQDDWAEKSLLRSVAREMEVLKRDLLRELAEGGREEDR